MAFIGVSISTIILKTTDALAVKHGLLVFTLPFNFITFSFLYSLRLVSFPLIPKATRKTPEATLDDYISGIYRFRNGTLCNLALPFSGKWTVWQGFDGKWTHQGALRYAYDFVIKRDGKTFKNEGFVLEDYYCYRKPVLSPSRGRVIRIQNDKPDNIPGTVDRESNWGNYVIIDTEMGCFVELSHFAQGSIKVKEGQWVEIGEQLGLCGNSGYSPQPHIHVQIQTTAALNSPTIPFNFYTFFINNKAINNDLPSEGQEIEPLYLDREMDLKTSFVLDQQFIYSVYKKGKHHRDVTLTVSISNTGETYFDSGKGRLFFFKGSHHFYFYRMEGNDPILSSLFMALPKMPLNYRKGMIWNDVIPVSAVKAGICKQLLFLMRIFNHRFGHIRYTARWKDSKVFIGIVDNFITNKKVRVKVALHDNLGFQEINSNGTRWVLKEIKW